MIRNSCSKGLGRSVDRPACLTRRSFGASNLAAGKGSADLNCIPQERGRQFKVQPSFFVAAPGARRLFCARKATQSKVKGKAKTKVEGKSKVRAKVKEVLAVLRMRQRCPLCCQQLGLSLPGAMLWCFAVREIGWAFRAGFPGFALGTLQSMVIVCDRDALKRPECRVRSRSGILSRGKNCSDLGFCRDGVSGHVQTARLKRLYRKKVAGNRRYRAQSFICARNTVPGARLRAIWISREAGFARSRSCT